MTQAPWHPTALPPSDLPGIDWLPAPLLVVDERCMCCAVSDGALELMGARRPHLLGEGWLDFFDDARPNVRWISAMAGLNGGALSLELTSASSPKRHFRLKFRAMQDHPGHLSVMATDITAECAAEDETAHYKAFLDQMQDVSRAGYWRYDVSTGHVSMSDRVFEILGLPQDPAGIKIERIFQAYHPDDQDEVRTIIAHCLETGEPFDVQLRACHPNGEERYVAIQGEAEPVAEGTPVKLFGVLQDVSEGQQDQADKLVMQERLKLVVEASRDGVWDWGLGNDEVFFSDRLKDMLGIEKEDNCVALDEARAIFHPDDRPDFRRSIEQYMQTGSSIEYEMRLRHADGTYRWFEIKAVAAFGDDGKPTRLVGSAGDITQRRASEDALKEAQAEAVKTSKAKSEFVATVSHELRTPLNGVIGMLDLMAHANLNSDQQPLADTAMDSAVGLLAILDDLLDLSKLGADRLELNPSEFSTFDLVQNVIHLFAPTAAKRDMGIFLNVDPNVPKQLVADQMRLKQILSNLIGNALKFTDSGSINVYVSQIEGVAGASQIRFAVQDTGIGIVKAAQERLFEPYSQGTEKTSEEFGGTGLGLAICKQLTERMGGLIGVESEPGMGSTFWFTINYEDPGVSATEDTKQPETVVQSLSVPDEVEAEAEAEAKAELETEISEPNVSAPSVLMLPVPLPRGVKLEDLVSDDLDTSEEQAEIDEDYRDPSKPHLLIAEDNAVNQRVITAMVTRLGYTFDMVGDGVEAIEAARNKSYDAVLMDVQMPKIDGVMATRLIREEERDLGRHVPIIAITAHAMRGTREDYMAAGMTDFIPKPISVKTLAVTLHRLCKNEVNEGDEEKSTAFGARSA